MFVLLFINMIIRYTKLYYVQERVYRDPSDTITRLSNTRKMCATSTIDKNHYITYNHCFVLNIIIIRTLESETGSINLIEIFK